MKISLQNLGKRFNREWLFRNLNFQLLDNHSYAIVGPNGSGKSTLLQVIAGFVLHNEGSVTYEGCSPEKVYRNVAIAAPYLDLIEELTLKEQVEFHQKLKPLIPGTKIESLASTLGLERAINKEIRYFSSGMKQRLKLGLAVFSDVPVILLDEPSTNLDKDGIILYHRLINEHCKDRLLVISSNDVSEYDFCDEMIDLRLFR